MWKRYAGTPEPEKKAQPSSAPVKKKAARTQNDAMVIDEDDLLKDMDLSDLDDLNLDDFD